MKKNFIILILGVFLMGACATQEKVLYFQDVQVDSLMQISKPEKIKMQPNDMISIVVSSRNPEIAMIFNLPEIRRVAGQSSAVGVNNSGDLSGYTVDTNGEIDFPVLGKLKIEGMTKEEVGYYIKKRLIDAGMVDDPIVTVSFLNLEFSILGDVARPGTYNLSKEITTILDAISMAGDLNITAKRDMVLLTRSENGKIKNYRLNLRSQEIYRSPAFYIQQNDLIYVEPNRVKSNQSTVNANSFQSVAFWMSFTSFVTSMIILFQ